MYGRSDLHKVVLILSVLARVDFSALKRAVLSLTFEWKKYPHARLSAFGTHNTHWRMSEDHKRLQRSAMNGQWSKGSFANRWSKYFGRLYIRNIERFVSNFIYTHIFLRNARGSNKWKVTLTSLNNLATPDPWGLTVLWQDYVSKAWHFVISAHWKLCLLLLLSIFLIGGSLSKISKKSIYFLKSTAGFS